MGTFRKIMQIPTSDRPREKLQNRGVTALSDFELLEVIIGSGTRAADVGTIARHLQRLFHRGIEAVTLESLTEVRGISIAHASKILAALELSRRHLTKDIEPLRSQHDILTCLSDIRLKQQEYLICMSLDGGQRLIAQRTVTIGTLDAVMAHPREVYADVIADRAASIIVAHNHPSGVAEPSDNDIALTQQLASAGQLLGVQLFDHIIVTRADYFSFREHRLI